MAQYARKTFGLFKPDSKDPFKISRSKIDLFVECPRCFYLDQRLGIKRPDMPGFSLNIAVDTLLKKEFDIHRAAGTPHPLMKTYKLDAVPFFHEKLEEWRDALRHGISCLHRETNLFVRGGIDDVWAAPSGELFIVDYKATAKEKDPDIDGEYQVAYKRQMEVYQWLFRQNGFKVSSTGYFVYVNGKSDRKAFDGKLEFDVFLIPYTGDDSWVSKTLEQIKQCLLDSRIPLAAETCKYCSYTKLVQAEALHQPSISGHTASRTPTKHEKSETKSQKADTLF